MADAKNSNGKIIQILGAVVDVEFVGNPPPINTALTVKSPSVPSGILTLEVAAHLGESRVRAIALSTTDGLKRGQEVINTKAEISVPVGKEILGRMFNVIGEPIDDKPKPKRPKHFRFIGQHQNLKIKK